MNTLGDRLWMIADYEGAKEALERVLEIREHHLGPEHPYTRDSRHALTVLFG